MAFNKVQWEIHYNNLSLRQENGYQPQGTIRQSFRWIWKVNHENASRTLYRDQLSHSNPTQLYFSFTLQLFAGFARMHSYRNRLKHRETPWISVIPERTIMLKVPDSPDPNKGKAVIIKMDTTL
jgi:hypothetical protein